MENTAAQSMREEEMSDGLARISFVDPPLLPYDVIGEVARALVHEGAYGSAAQLNRCSRAVHEATLAILYETMVLYDAAALARSWERTVSKGIEYVKYIIGTPQTIEMVLKLANGTLESPNTHHGPTVSVSWLFSCITSLIRPRCKCQDCPDALTASDARFRQAFPQLVFCSALDETPEYLYDGWTTPSDEPDESTATARLVLLIYQPVSVDVVFDRLTADRTPWQISFFGIQLDRHATENSVNSQARNIDSVVIKEGAWLIPPLNGRELDVHRDAVLPLVEGRRRLRSCRVSLEGRNPAPEVASVLELAMDCAMFEGERGRYGSEGICELKVRQAGLKILTGLIRARPSSTVPIINVRLAYHSGSPYSDLQHHLVSLAKAYPENWTHRPARHGETFLQIKIPLKLTKGLQTITDGVMVGCLTFGRGNGSTEADHAGFSADISIGRDYDTAGPSFETFATKWEQYYPCADVPLVWPTVTRDGRDAGTVLGLLMRLLDGELPWPEGMAFPPGFEMDGEGPEWMPEGGMGDGDVESEDGIQDLGIREVRFGEF